MFETSDFSHTSSRYGGLSDRLKAANVEYQSAGENIAAIIRWSCGSGGMVE